MACINKDIKPIRFLLKYRGPRLRGKKKFPAINGCWNPTVNWLFPENFCAFGKADCRQETPVMTVSLGQKKTQNKQQLQVGEFKLNSCVFTPVATTRWPVVAHFKWELRGRQRTGSQGHDVIKRRHTVGITLTISRAYKWPPKVKECAEVAGF